MTAQMGGLRITEMDWIGQHTLEVRYETNLVDRFFQLYAGRKLVGVSETMVGRVVLGQVMPTLIPPPMTLLAVTPDDRLTNFGHKLPPRPWNRYRLDWSANSYPPDSRFFDVEASPAAGEEPETLLARVEYLGDISYSFDLPELTSGGLWQYRLTPRDNALPLGNAGTAETVEIAALVYPADVALDEDGNRFQVALVEGVATISFDWGDA